MARQRHQLRQQVLLHRLFRGRETQHRVLERELVADVDEVEEGDRLQEVGLVVGEEDDTPPRQVLQQLVALDVDVVEDREVGDGEADAEAGEDAPAQPAVEEGAGRQLLRQHAADQAHAGNRAHQAAGRAHELARQSALSHPGTSLRGAGDLTPALGGRHVRAV
ncbi:MAG TPA: hypothetical protein VI297_06595, partial [Gemmatimonadales bacterium]